MWMLDPGFRNWGSRISLEGCHLRRFIWITSTVALVVILGASASDSPRHSLQVSGRQFLLDGKPFQIISGEMHYARIPREDWHDRLKMARAMGLNTISTYVFWNLHEPKPGVYDFTGQLDVAAFIRAAQKEGLYVILRPGPYVCAEWDLGGLPAWLLADPTVILRSDDPKFMQPVARWLKRLGQELAPLQAARGGPILAVQVENEYGSFDSDHQYMKHIYELIAGAGFSDSLLYTADGPEQLPKGTLPGVPAVVNFGPGEAQHAFETLAAFRPNQPLMAGEYWAGWFDEWGGKHAATDTAQQVADLKWMLMQGYSVNFYMFHGGTTFGFMNGANFYESYKPQTTSYDYDAALDESGRPTKKYFAFQEVIVAHNPAVKLPDVPQTSPLITVPPFALTESGSLWGNLGYPVWSDAPETMETLRQAYGYVLYRTNIAGAASGELNLDGMHDYAKVYVNGVEQATFDRRLNQPALTIRADQPDNTLDILVENGGRVNFGKHLRDQRKGIAPPVTFAGKELRRWQIYLLPMTDLNAAKFVPATPKEETGPGFARGTFSLTVTGDTFLDMRGFAKGVAWVNGHLLGRFWSIGPQQTLYVPAPWLKVGTNEVVIFDLEPKGTTKLRGLAAPVYSQ
jgi:beta-galactosidase